MFQMSFKLKILTMILFLVNSFLLYSVAAVAVVVCTVYMSMQSMSVIAKFVSSILVCGEAHSIQHYKKGIKYISD